MTWRKYIQEQFTAVDARFGTQWEYTVPYKIVEAKFHEYDTYWDTHLRSRRGQGGLVALCAPGAADYATYVKEIAEEFQKRNEARQIRDVIRQQRDEARYR